MADETAPKTKRIYDPKTGLWTSVPDVAEPAPVQKVEKKAAKKKKRK